MNRILSALAVASMALSGTALAAPVANSQNPNSQAQTSQTQQASEPGECPCGAGHAKSGAEHAGVCGNLTSKADVLVQDTGDGAVIHFKAKSPDNVGQIQKDVATMGACMGGGQPCPSGAGSAH